MTTADYHALVCARLNDAGRILMMLPDPVDAMPEPAHAHWPAITREYWELWGGLTADERKRITADRHRPYITPNSEQITRMDEVLEWLRYVDSRPHRRTVARRMLVHPISERHLFSWADIGRHLGTSRRNVRRWYEYGINDIVESLANGR